MKKDTLYIGLEFIFGPIQKDVIDKNGHDITGISLVDNNEEIQKLDKEIGNIWCSLYSDEFNDDGSPRFDKKREKEIAPMLLDKINQLLKLINSVNNGSFEVEDMITDYLKTLINK